MKADIAERWITALRSGKYKQTDSYLYKGKDQGYCCLGVLCDVLGYEFESRHGDVYYVKDTHSAKALPTRVLLEAGMRSAEGNIGNSVNKTLAALNDNGVDFQQIANIIEKNWEQL